MIKLEYVVFFLLFAGSGAYVWHFFRRLRRDHFSKLVERAFLRRQASGGENAFFCEPLLRRIVVLLLRDGKKALRPLLALTLGRHAPAEKYLRSRGRELEALLLRAHVSPQRALPGLKKYVRKNPQNRFALAALAELCFVAGDAGHGQAALDNISLKRAPRYVLGIYWYYQTSFYLREGDMLAASQACVRAEKYFLREKAFYAAARCRLLMGTVYRVCFVEDVASFMFRGALKIFEQLHCPQGRAAAFGNLGMLNALTEHFDEAQGYFEQARELYDGINAVRGRAEIDNQLGLLEILRRNFSRAEKYLQTAAQGHEQADSLPGLALNAELFSYLEAARNRHVLSRRYAEKAEELYRRIGNESARLESLYLQAEAWYAGKKDKKAETVLRRIIQEAGGHSTSFHIANAYCLLGLVFMRRGELQRAKGLFQQSLEQEQKNDRWSGQACDYANIGLLELRCGRKEQAETHLNAALELALSLDNREMADFLKRELEKLKA